MPPHFGTAARAALTASRASLRDARATFCPSASYVRPDSLRGNAPPMNSLYVLRTGSLTSLTAFGSRLAEPGSTEGSRRWTTRFCGGPCYSHCAALPRLPATRQEREVLSSFECQVRFEPVAPALAAEA